MMVASVMVTDTRNAYKVGWLYPSVLKLSTKPSVAQDNNTHTQKPTPPTK